MRVFVLLATLAFISRVESASVISHENLAKLVLSDQAISRVAGQENDNRPRHLRSYATEATEKKEDDSLDEERGPREQLAAKLLALDTPTFNAVFKKLDDFLASGKADDVLVMNNLKEQLSPQKVSAFLKAKNLDELLGVTKKVDPKKLDVVVNLQKGDTGELATYLTKTLFTELRDSGVKPGILRNAMETHGGFSDKFIKGAEAHYAFFRTHVKR